MKTIYLLLISFCCFGKQNSSYSFEGFSPDGAAVAFTEIFNTEIKKERTFHIINVNQNRYHLKTGNTRRWEKGLKRHNISQKDYGTRVAHKPVMRDGEIFKSDLLIDSKPYQLILEYQHAGRRVFQHFSFHLYLKYNGKIFTLQRDQKLPPSRGNAVDYHIEACYTYRGKIAVILSYRRYTETPKGGTFSSHFLMVTGELPSKK